MPNPRFNKQVAPKRGGGKMTSEPRLPQDTSMPMKNPAFGGADGNLSNLGWNGAPNTGPFGPFYNRKEGLKG